MTQVWAHRGARLEHTENTVAAFAAAIDAGADGIELDVHVTADGVLVVHHDAAVAQADGTLRPLAELTAAEACAVRLDEAGSTIPTLSDVYALVAPTDLVLNVELKESTAPHAALAELAITAQRASGMADRVIHSSFDHYALRAMRALDPEADIAPLYESGLVEPWEYVRRLGARAAHPWVATLLAPGILAGYAEAGISVRAWTVDEPSAQQMLIAAGIDAIIVDDPKAAIAMRDHRAGGADASP